MLRERYFDPFWGVTKEWHLADDKIIQVTRFDPKDFITQTKASVVDESFIGSDKAMHKMASLPLIVVEEILIKHGLNIMGEMSPADQRKLHRIIETEYPWCKTHTRKLWRPIGGTE